MTTRTPQPAPPAQAITAATLEARLAAAAREQHLGPTGEQPKTALPGSMGPAWVGITIEDNHVILNLGQRLAWLAMSASQARELARGLISQAEKLEQQGQAQGGSNGHS